MSTDQRPARPFIEHFPEAGRSFVANQFLLPVRAGIHTLEAVIMAVKANLRRRLAHGNDERTQRLLALIGQYPSDALADARYALWYEALPADDREALKLRSREQGQQAWMQSQPATEKQLAYLRALGHVGSVASKAEASRLIDRLAGRR